MHLAPGGDWNLATPGVRHRDGAGWEGVYKILKTDGYSVSIVQNSTVSLDADVAATRRILGEQDGVSILVGLSYGGAVITEAGNDSSVAGLV